jgi:hypothetical protein
VSLDRKGRSKLTRRIAEGFFGVVPREWDKSLDALQEEYYVFFRQRGASGMDALWKEALERHIELLR